MTVSFQYLNHAAMLLSAGGVHLLSDPWLEGTAFSGGWGLAYENPRALERASEATHLWISHWHSDHLHAPTLAKLAARSPEMVVLANVSANFSMVERLRSFGFRDVRPLGEREPMRLGEACVVTRFPTAGIDNMLRVATPEGVVLNYNDCNLPAAAIARLRPELGPIDVLLTNYNHAGKLFDERPDEATKDLFFGSLVRAVDALGPRVVLPFASSHFYRSPYSVAQNASLIDFDELERRTAADARFTVLRVGEGAVIEGGRARRLASDGAVTRAERKTHDYGASVAWPELMDAVSARCLALGRGFGPGSALVPALRVRVADQARVLLLRAGRSAREAPAAEPADIEAHSRAIADWHGRRFGDDTFFAGAHFGLEAASTDARAIRAWALVTLLAASHLDPRSALRYLASREGRGFLWNRREEIVGTLSSGSVRAGDLRV